MKKSIILLAILGGLIAGFYFLRESNTPLSQILSFNKEDLVCEEVRRGRGVRKRCWRVKPEPITDGLTKPLHIARADDGSSRLFVVEKTGTIQVVEDNSLSQEPFLDISDVVLTRFNEQGLLGLAFHPNFANNGYFFVNYTNREGNNVVSRFSVSDSNPNMAEPESEKKILTIDQPEGHHNCGTLAFGLDGFLYICTGDGGGDPRAAQDKSSLLGKVLRIDVDSGDPYSIPEKNPFVAEEGTKGEIWASGLRNPWQLSFDRETGDLYFGDAGEDIYEEVNFEPEGSVGGNNYGWPHFEGKHCTKEVYKESDKNFDFADCSFEYQPPIYEYLHEPPDLELTKDCSGSVTGGNVYRGKEYPILDGVYIFGDFCTGAIRGLSMDETGDWEVKEFFRDKKINPTGFGGDKDGELYFVGFFDGVLYKISAEVVD